MDGGMINGPIDRALKPGKTYSEREITEIVVGCSGVNPDRAAMIRVEMLMRGELVLEPGVTDDDALFRRVKRLP